MIEFIEINFIIISRFQQSFDFAHPHHRELRAALLFPSDFKILLQIEIRAFAYFGQRTQDLGDAGNFDQTKYEFETVNHRKSHGVGYSKLPNIRYHLQNCNGRCRLFLSEYIKHVRYDRAGILVCAIVDTANNYR